MSFFLVAPIFRYSCYTIGDFLLLRGSLMQLRDVETATIGSNWMLGELARQVRASFKPIVDLSQRRCQRVLALLYGPAQLAFQLFEMCGQFCFGLFSLLAEGLQLRFDERAQILDA